MDRSSTSLRVRGLEVALGGLTLPPSDLGTDTDPDFRRRKVHGLGCARDSQVLNPRTCIPCVLPVYVGARACMLRARRMHALALDKDGRVAQSIAKDLIDILNGSVN